MATAQNYSQRTGFPDGESTEEINLPRQLQAIASGDKNAFAGFYDETAGQVYALALRVTCRSAEAEEVVSEVYLQVWRQALSYDASRGSPRGWLLTMCRSRALDHLRRRDRAEPHPEPEQIRPDQFQHDEDPQNLMLAVERDSAVHAALVRLSPLQRQLLAFAFFRGLTHQEIATQIEMPLGTVKTHIRKALKTLQGELGTATRLGLVTS